MLVCKIEVLVVVAVGDFFMYAFVNILHVLFLKASLFFMSASLFLSLSLVFLYPVVLLNMHVYALKYFVVAQIFIRVYCCLCSFDEQQQQ